MVPARALMLVAACMLAACGRDAPPRAAPDPAARAAFERGEAAWRAQRREALLAPDGWTSLVGLHWLAPGAHYIGTARDNGIRIRVGPAQLGMIDVRPPRVRVVAARGAGVQLDGAPLRGGATLRLEGASEGASRIGFDDGKGIATVIRRGDRYALRVRHADAPTRTGFTTLDYWPGGREWAIDARYVAHPPGRTIDITNIVGTVEATPNPGAVEFVRRGRRIRLEAVPGEGGALLVMFADGTSGHGSFGPGRYLDVAAPDASGRVRLDFNRAYNPPCAFTAFATCPLPPLVNRITLAIRAGEKAYTGPH